jgi:hypothetical protein
LTGSAGAGKTLLAEAIAHEMAAELPHQKISIRMYHPGRMTADEIATDNNQGTELFIFDELDDASPKIRQKTSSLIQQTISKGGYIVVTARQMPKFPFDLKDFRFRVLNLGPPQISPNAGTESQPIEIYVDPGQASSQTLKELFEALSDLHVAAGGLGLEYKTDGNSIFAVSEVEQ